MQYLQDFIILFKAIFMKIKVMYIFNNLKIILVVYFLKIQITILELYLKEKMVIQ